MAGNQNSGKKIIVFGEPEFKILRDNAKYASMKGLAALTSVSLATFKRIIQRQDEVRFIIELARSQLEVEMCNKLVKKALEENDTTALIFWMKTRHPDFQADREPDETTELLHKVLIHYFDGQSPPEEEEA